MVSLLRKVQWWLQRRRREDDLREELAFHVTEEANQHQADGLSENEATWAARRDLGNATVLRENIRATWSWALLDELGQDLRYAARTLRRSPAFVTAAAATLALAIGANTVIFSVVDAVLLRPLPYQSPEQLAMLWTEDPTQNLREGRSSLWDVEQWRSQSESFTDMATFDSVSTLLTSPDGVEQIVGASVSPNLLPLLGVQPVLGRGLLLEEAEQRQRLVLISHGFWQARFSGSHDALGAALVLNGVPSQIVGVLPADFQVGSFDADVWEPHRIDRSVRGPQTWFVIGRLRPGVTFNHAQTEMNTIARRINADLPAAERNRGISVVPLSLQMVGAESRVALWLLGGAVLCVLLIAATNVASLTLARSVARTREMAVRTALGAGTSRIVRQLITESVLLAVFSGLIGTALAFAGLRLIRALGPDNLPRLSEVSLDLRALAWVLALSLSTGILVGLAPVMATLRRDARLTVGEGGRTIAGGSGTRRVRRALVVAEFAIAIVLFVGAGLLVRSWWNARSIDPGFMPERVLVMELSSPTTIAGLAQRTALYQRVVEQLQAVPGVESVGIIGDLFIANSSEQALTVQGDAGTVSERLRFRRDEVNADFFKTLGTPLRGGRFFSTSDGPDAPRVAIVNEAMARRLWPGQDPIGARFKLGSPDSERPWYTIVGVVGDMRRQGLERQPVPQIFEPLAQNPPQSVDLFIRTSTEDPLTMAGALRAAVRRVEKQAPIYGVAHLEQQLGTYLAQRRFQTSLLTGFSVLALLMAAVGIYGLVQYSIVTRTQEIGLRIAVGAQASDIFRMVIGEGLTLTLIGLALGLTGAWWLGQAASSLLFGVTAHDPLTLTTVSALLTAVAIAACYVPARRAMTVDPVVALRAS
jgi:putative ABC transport system permease protein